VDEAGALLGHYYWIEGAVVEGQRRGRTIGFPTANLRPDNELIPPRGVYATITMLDGVAYQSLTNIGTRPTFENDEAIVIETHVLDFDRDLYDSRMRLG